jgi:flagellin-like protein
MVFYKNNKGLSGIVATVILILLVIVATTVVWTMVRGFIDKKTQGVQSCFDVSFSDKVSLNQDYTCFDFEKNETQFSINIGDIEVEKLIVSISYAGTSKSYILTKEVQTFDDLISYPSRESEIVIPNKNSGLTYIVTGVTAQPEWVKISPYIGDKQCDVTDTIYELEDCSLFE